MPDFVKSVKHAFRHTRIIMDQVDATKAALKKLQAKATANNLKKQLSELKTHAANKAGEHKKELDAKLDRLTLPIPNELKSQYQDQEQLRKLKTAVLLARVIRAYEMRHETLPPSIELLKNQVGYDKLKSDGILATIDSSLKDDKATANQLGAQASLLHDYASAHYCQEYLASDVKTLGELLVQEPTLIGDDNASVMLGVIDRMDDLCEDLECVQRDTEFFANLSSDTKLAAPTIDLGDGGKYANFAKSINTKLKELHELHNLLKQSPNSSALEKEYLARRAELNRRLKWMKTYLDNMRGSSPLSKHGALDHIGRKFPEHNHNMQRLEELGKQFDCKIPAQKYMGNTTDIEMTDMRDYGKMTSITYNPNGQPKQYKETVHDEDWDPDVAAKALVRFKKQTGKPEFEETASPLEKTGDVLKTVGKGLAWFVGLGQNKLGLSTGLFGDGTVRERPGGPILRVKLANQESQELFMKLYKEEMAAKAQKKQSVKVDGESELDETQSSKVTWRAKKSGADSPTTTEDSDSETSSNHSLGM